MEAKNNYRYTITDRLGNLIVQPLGESDFSVEWSRDKDDGKRVYGREFGGNITFIGDAYARLLKIERSIYRCEYQNINIERRCSGNWNAWFSGRISLNEGEWDLDKCIVVLKFEEEKAEQCFDDNKSVKVNLISEVEVKREVFMFPGNVSLEYRECEREATSGSSRDIYWCGEEATPSEGKWNSYYSSSQAKSGGGRTEIAKWVRMVMTVECTITPSLEWKLVEDNCPSNRKYVREAILFSCGSTKTGSGDSLLIVRTCSFLWQELSEMKFRNGLPLGDVLGVFMSKFCTGKTVKSDFFQINPDVVTDINYVTNEKSKVREITLFQKSDVKRPDNINSATKAELTFEKLMQALNYMFNVEWRITGNQMIIEHVSFFQKDIGKDLTLPQYSKYIKGKRKYTYKNEGIPNQENWKWKEQENLGNSGGSGRPVRGGLEEQRTYIDFAGLPIIYTGGCVTQGNKNVEKNYVIEDFVSDVEFVVSNPDSDSKNVSDEGFVIMATEYSGTKYHIITEAPILSTVSKINNSLAMAQLHRDYHKFERPLKYGNMNGIDTEFYSVIPTKKGEKISIPLCCEETFNPDDLVVTDLGNGVVDKATFSFKNSMLELDLLYDANVGLTPNEKPVATNEAVSTGMNESIIIDVLANDTDPDGNATITAIEIMIQPSHGVAEVMSDLKIKYTPTTGYTGNDSIVYRIKDDWNEPSNNALISITVYNSKWVGDELSASCEQY